MKILPFLLLTMTLAGCTTMGPDYQRPETEIPSTWRSAVPKEEKLVDTEWWHAFADPVLSGLIDQAVLGNRDLLLATARVDQYLALLETARAQFFPQVGYALGANRQDNAIPPLSTTNPPAYSTFQAALNVAWELDLWGRIRRADEAARAQVLATEEDRRAVLISLISNVASSYITLRGYDRQLEIARETSQSYQETRRIFRLRHRHGTISGIELKQIESQYESAAQTIPHIEALIARQEHLLSILLGKNPGAIPRGKVLDEFSTPLLPVVLPLSLLERRPDIRQAEYQLIAANARIGEAKALYFPTISLSGLLGRQSSELSDLFRSGAGFWSLGGSVAGSLISSGAVSGQVAQAAALARQALLRYEQTIQEAFREVEDALVSTLKFNEQLQAQRRQIEILSEYARLSRLTFESGSTTYLQVLDAERALFSAQLNLIQTKVNVLDSTIKLYRSLAGEWINEV
ncbi:MAG: efflux transporter outer membrane subunit [Desulfofustis sp.]|nr:efflux transporter outer membrane subunit [Desulfofustis sp.]